MRCRYEGSMVANHIEPGLYRPRSFALAQAAPEKSCPGAADSGPLPVTGRPGSVREAHEGFSFLFRRI